MTERETKPTSAEERAQWLASICTEDPHVSMLRLIDDIADRDAEIAALKAEAEDARAMVRSLNGLVIKHGCPAGHAEKYAWLDTRLGERAALREKLAAAERERDEARANGDRARERIRECTQLIIEQLGSRGPEDLEHAVSRAIAVLSAKTPSARREAFEKLRIACIRRCDFVREKP